MVGDTTSDHSFIVYELRLYILTYNISVYMSTILGGFFVFQVLLHYNG